VVVEAAAWRARRASIEWGAHIIARRAEELTASVNFPADD
jgi:hypothetical protein